MNLQDPHVLVDAPEHLGDDLVHGRLGAGRRGHDAGIDPKVAADQRGHGIGVAIDVYTKAALSRRAEAAEQLENAVLTA